jgi:predicted nucleic-acid-binding Zn-ribbon protein
MSERGRKPRATDSSASAERDFICPKCRGRQADVREIILTKSGILDLLPGKDNRYLEVTCVLCGYTEFYNRAIRLRGMEAIDQEARLPLPEKPEAR